MDGAIFFNTSETPTKTPMVIIGYAIYVRSATAAESASNLPPIACKNSSTVLHK